MPKRISDLFQVDPTKLKDNNVFNGFVDIDSKLYVDPRLLEKTSAPELVDSYEKFTDYFDDVFKDIENFIKGKKSFENAANILVRDTIFTKKAGEIDIPLIISQRDEYLDGFLKSQAGDHAAALGLVRKTDKSLFLKSQAGDHAAALGLVRKTDEPLKPAQIETMKAIIRKLTFAEIPVTGLGYSINTNVGKGIGDGLARKLLKNAIEIAELGILDSIFFELIGLLIEGFGADRISDMTIHILHHELVQFSCRIAESLNLPKASNGLPYFLGKEFLLVPQDILTKLPLAEKGSWTDADAIAIHNQQLREAVNKKIGKSLSTWNEIIKQKSLHLIHDPQIGRELMEDLFAIYRSKSAKPYDFEKDPEGEFRWHDRSRYYCKLFPLNLNDQQDKSNEIIIDCLIKVFSNSVRNCSTKNDLCFEFYQESGKPNDEKLGQLILLESIENYIKGSCLSVEYDAKTGFIKLSNKSQESRIILKYLSKKGVVEYYEKIVNEGQGNGNRMLSSTTIIFIRILANKTASAIEKIEAFEKKFRDSNIEIPRKFIIDGRVEVYSKRKRLFGCR